MSFSFLKQPDEKVRVGWDFSEDLASGDSIVSATYAVINKTSGDAVVTAGLTVAGTGKISNENLNNVPSVNDTASIRVISGDHNMRYKLTVLGTTASGDTYEGDIFIDVLNQ